ncbi:hypothetical protein Neosp_015195 [[Neocosmospora] mangrovei]
MSMTLSELDEEIHRFCDDVTKIPRHEKAWSAYKSRIALLCGIRYDATHLKADLDAAIEAATESVDATAIDHFYYSGRLSNLGSRLHDLYARTGRLSDLEKAVECTREAVQSTPPDHPNIAIHLITHGGNMLAKYSKTKSSVDLDEGKRASEKALELGGENSEVLISGLKNLAFIHNHHYLSTGSVPDIEKAVQIGRQLVLLDRDGSKEKPIHLADLALCLRNLSVAENNLDVLNEAIAVSRQALALTTEDHPCRAMCLRNVGSFLFNRHDMTRGDNASSLSDLDESIRLVRQVIHLLPEDDAARAANQRDLAERLGAKLVVVRELNISQESVQAARKSLDATAKDDPEWAQSLRILGLRLSSHFSLTNETQDLEEAIQTTLEAFQHTQQSHPLWLQQMVNLGSLFEDRYLRKGMMPDLDEAIQFGKKVLAETSKIDPKRLGDRANRSNNLATLLDMRYSASNSVTDLEEAVQFSREAVDDTPTDHPNQALHLSNLGSQLWQRYHRFSNITDLEEAIRVTRSAYKLLPEPSTLQLNTVHNLSTFLHTRFSRTGEISDLKEAIELGSEAVRNAPGDHHLRPRLLVNMANQMNTRYSRTGNMTDLEEAIRFATQATNAPANRSKEKALGTLGDLLGQRFVATGHISDIDKSIELLQQAIGVIPQDHPERPGYLSNLSMRLGARYSRMRSIPDLDMALQFAREAVDRTPKEHRDCTIRLDNLAGRLADRYARIGRMTDLEEAIRICRELADSTNEGRSDYPVFLHNLSLHLSNRHSRTKSLADLDDAIQFATKAVDSLAPGHTDRVERLTSLGVRLSERYQKTEREDHFNAALEVSRKAIEEAPKGHALRAACLNNLGSVLIHRCRRTARPTHLDESIRALREAVDLTPENHPERAGRLSNLGYQLGQKYISTKAPEALREATSFAQEALNQQSAPLIVRVLASRVALGCLATGERWQEAFDASDVALGMIPQLVLRSLDNVDKQHLLSQLAGLASEAAAVALRAGKGVLEAVKVLELGRGVLASSIEDLRTDVIGLQNEHPELANKFIQLKENLEAAGGGKSAAVTGIIEQYNSDEQFNALISEIRTKAGFESFLLAPNTAQLREAAKYGSIVIINVSMRFCEAFIVQESGERQIRLGNLDANEIERRAKEGNLGSRGSLEWLWDTIANPILTALGYTQTPLDDNWPRVWWIPTGALCRFPIHAAGYHLSSTSKTVLDRVVSSYSSSIKTMISTRRAALTQTTQDKALLVAMQQTPGQATLKFAPREVQEIHQICISMNLNPVEPRRRKAEVISHLRQCKIFHFAGHGHTEEADPSQSHLMLEDGEKDPLTVRELLDLNLSKQPPFLAYLSACGTGRLNDDRFADESIHLIGACQVAGFRHVIGTLWEVNDEACVSTAKAIYEGIRDGGMTDESVSQGLHRATRQLRDRWRQPLLKEDQGCVREALRGIERGVEASRESRLPRNFLLCEEDKEVEALHWVPYVHFGV